jgi:hypothetical protein
MPKYNVNFSDSAYVTLNELAEELGQSMAEVIRDALTTYWWLVQERKKGNTLLLQGKGKRSEVVFPSFARLGEDAPVVSQRGASRERPSRGDEQPAIAAARRSETPADGKAASR